MKTNKTFFLGEVMMRLDCTGNSRFVQAEYFRIRYTGAELNAAVAMRSLGAKDLHLITTLPDTPLGDAALNEAARWGISTEHCRRKPGRIGVMYLEEGFGARPSAVIYDRAETAFAQSRFEDYGFDQIFQEGDWLYISGTLPALAPDLPQFCKQVFQCAKHRGCQVVMDLNYRESLWSWERARQTFTELLQYTDILFGNESLAVAMLQTPAAELCRRFGLQSAALTRRIEKDSAENTCSAALYDQNGMLAESAAHKVKMLDRIGGGDAFSGAALWGLQQKMPPQKLVEYAEAALVLKQTIRGDFALITNPEINQYLNSDNITVRR